MKRAHPDIIRAIRQDRKNNVTFKQLSQRYGYKYVALKAILDPIGRNAPWYLLPEDLEKLKK